MTTVTLQRTHIEVPTTTKQGRPAYRWATGYYVIRPDGVKEYPPTKRKEAYIRARELGATRIVVTT